MSWKFKKSLNNREYILENEKGESRLMKRDLEGEARGDYLQPMGNDKGKFIEKFGWCPGEGKKEVQSYLKRKGYSEKEIHNLPGFGREEDNK